MGSRYGGTTTVLATLDVGTKFFVNNGHWDGSIIEKDGAKHLLISDERSISLTGSNVDYTLDITIKEMIKFEFNAHMGCRCSSVAAVVEVPHEEVSGMGEQQMKRYVYDKYFKPWLDKHIEIGFERVL